ncbi:MAG: hypothetical protein IKD89_07745 [Clostridia bacterium]|nr:hypothetical protein [Clostridia bacterium]
MANTPYDNFYLSNEIEDQFKSHLDLLRFVTVDNNLSGSAGMKRVIHTYSATDGTEKLAMGEGNTKDITAEFSEKEYEILLAQNRFKFYDEEAMNDPMLVNAGIRHAAADMFNTMNDDIFAEFENATLSLETETFDFGAFVQAAALLNMENLEGEDIFAFVSAADMGMIRRELSEQLRYSEDFARAGYVGTVAGINLYTKKDATPGEIIIATKDAVTLFNKTGTEVEQERDGNTRLNTVYSRKYYIAALTDATKAVKMILTDGEDEGEDEGENEGEGQQ